MQPLRTHPLPNKQNYERRLIRRPLSGRKRRKDRFQSDSFQIRHPLALVRGMHPAVKKLYFYEDELLAWIENGRRKTSEQTYEEMLANMQSGVRHKPKSSVKL